MTRQLAGLFLLCVLFCGICIGQDVQHLNLKINNPDSLKQAYYKLHEEEAIKRRAIFFSWLDDTSPDSIRELNFSGLYFIDMPDFSTFNHLTVINGSGNRLTKITKHSFVSDSLRKIDFSENEIVKFKVLNINKLDALILSNNKLKRIPRSIRKAKNLKYLNLENNRIKRIPRFLKMLDSLVEINLNYNQVNFNRVSAKRLAKINTILLAGNNLSFLPENIGEMSGVRKFNFSKNKLSELPESFKMLEKLTNIIFYQNEFIDIPSEIFYLKNLIELDFYYNKIDTIPDAIENLVSLKQLFLSFNQISILPEALKSLHNLRYLYVHHNNISIVPDWITEYSKLERLDLSYNKIFDVPDLSVMSLLSEIDLQENEIAYFPWLLLEKPNLRILVLKNNPFILSLEEKQLLENYNNDLNNRKLNLVF